ncbi:MAG: hypothetical protein JNK58_01925 [Phycisphaerae bacterium]|nr:hypothetical protein [Phycisphaerae bacterium]
MRRAIQQRHAGARTSRRAHVGVLTHWLASLTASQRRRLFDRLVRADVALASTLGHYQAAERIHRMGFLLMTECANARALHVGELALLFPSIEHEAVRALGVLARASRAATQEWSGGEQHAKND